jgi:hypothetical protein
MQLIVVTRPSKIMYSFNDEIVCFDHKSNKAVIISAKSELKHYGLLICPDNCIEL